MQHKNPPPPAIPRVVDGLEKRKLAERLSRAREYLNGIVDKAVDKLTPDVHVPERDYAEEILGAADLPSFLRKQDERLCTQCGAFDEHTSWCPRETDNPAVNPQPEPFDAEQWRKMNEASMRGAATRQPSYFDQLTDEERQRFFTEPDRVERMLKAAAEHEHERDRYDALDSLVTVRLLKLRSELQLLLELIEAKRR